MLTLEVTPLQGLGIVRFGMPKEEVEKLVGLPDSSTSDASAYFDGDLVIGFDGSNRVSFFGVGQSKAFRLLYDGREFLYLSFLECLTHFEKHEKAEDLDDEGRMFLFKEMNLALNRDANSELDDEGGSGSTFSSINMAPKGDSSWY